MLRLVPTEDLEAELEKTCVAIASKPRGVIALGKKFYHRQMELPLKAAYKELVAFVHTRSLSESSRGLAGFLRFPKDPGFAKDAGDSGTCRLHL